MAGEQSRVLECRLPPGGRKNNYATRRPPALALLQRIFDEIKARTKETDPLCTGPTAATGGTKRPRAVERPKQVRCPQCRCSIADPTELESTGPSNSTKNPKNNSRRAGAARLKRQAEGHDFLFLLAWRRQRQPPTKCSCYSRRHSRRRALYVVGVQDLAPESSTPRTRRRLRCVCRPGPPDNAEPSSTAPS